MDDYKQGLLDAIAEIDAELECVEIEYADAPPCLKAARRVLTNAKQLIVDKLAIETPGAEKAAIAAAVEAEREARQEAQRRLEALQERTNHADKEKAQAVEAERERCANLCEKARFTGNTFPRTQMEQLRMDIAAAIRGN